MSTLLSSALLCRSDSDSVSTARRNLVMFVHVIGKPASGFSQVRRTRATALVTTATCGAASFKFCLPGSTLGAAAEDPRGLDVCRRAT